MIWYNLKDKQPIATETGGWDGLKSDKILVATIGGRVHVVEMYEGIIYGVEFRNFYDAHDWEIDNVKYWTEIDMPF